MDRSNVAFNFQITDTNGKVLHETNVSYQDVSYADLVAMEKILIEAMQKLGKLGEEKASRKK